MARGPRPEEAGGLFHISTKAIREHELFVDDRDRSLFLLGLAEVVGDLRWRCLTYCLMRTHYHFLVLTPDPNLGVGMKRLNGDYAESFNRRHRHRGHLFGDRYWSEPVQRDEHLLEVFRYIALNPVRAGAVATPEQWRWSAHRWLIADEPPLGWLAVDAALAYFAGPGVNARTRYRRFVEDALPTARTSAR